MIEVRTTETELIEDTEHGFRVRVIVETGRNATPKIFPRLNQHNMYLTVEETEAMIRLLKRAVELAQ